jgi:single-stranded-DNA-specific exonuclease
LFTRSVATDGALTGGEIGPELVAAIEAIVWGQGFAAPLFVNDFEVLEQRLVQSRHLQLTLGLDRVRLPAIWFGHVEALPPRARLAYRPKFDEFRGLRRISLQIEYSAL